MGIVGLIVVLAVVLLVVVVIYKSVHLIGPTDVIITLVKSALFGLSAGLIACYKGTSVRGGPAGVGSAVNETVVYSFVALFVINVIATAVGVKVTL